LRTSCAVTASPEPKFSSSAVFRHYFLTPAP
jgi:hypothetical protein